MRTWRLLTLAAVLTGVMTGTVFSADTVKVFRYDGSLQCGMGQAVPLDEMAKELTAANIKVLSSEKRVVSGFIIALCGAPTGMANVYEIAKDDLPRIPAGPQGVKRFQPWVYDGPSIEVAKYDGSLQCEMGQTRVTGRNGEGVACCEHRRTGESQEGGWDSTPADVRSIDGHDERVPNQHDQTWRRLEY